MQRTDPLLFDVVHYGEHTCLDSVGVDASPATSGSQVTYEGISATAATSCGQVTLVEVSRSTPGVGFMSPAQAACSSQVMSEVVSGSGSTAGLRGDEVDMPDLDYDDTGINAGYLDDFEFDGDSFFA